MRYSEYENTYLKSVLYNYLKSHNIKISDILILCIGTDRSTGDSYGPMIGTILREKAKYDYSVLGTLDTPIHNLNYDEYAKRIKSNKELQNKFIIAIDSTISRNLSEDDIGLITINKNQFTPGAAKGEDEHNGKLEFDVSILGTVAMNFNDVSAARLSDIIDMAHVTSTIILDTFDMINGETT